ncbi:unnamed protein product [Phytophthora fragariaefolia]|uniref:Unnamed protein product n=1 Tax=Phytophthora fragariaefolia TaxID=1490495 RepID=A0A9W6XFU0_9STRA|nr:unnamed protein product [Phytophthora fragariaefolia]
MANYRKFGHPDGPQSMLMNVAFASAFSGASGSTGSVFVLLYFGVVFAGLAYLVYWLQKTAGRRDRTQISRATRDSFVEALTEKMSVHDVVELLLSCDEMAGPAAGILDEAKNEAQLRAKTHDKLAKKMEAARALPSEVIGRIRKHPNPVARENMLALYQYLRRDKLRGVSRPSWVDQRLQKVLLELPFLVDIFATMAAEQLVKRAYPAIPLLRALSLLSSITQGSFVPDEVALRDQSERIAEVDGKLPKLHLEGTTLAVLDEANIQPGDWLTLQTTLQRQHLEAGKTAPLAATFFDHVDPKSPFRKEHVWFLVMDKGTGRLYAAWKTLFENPWIRLKRILFLDAKGTERHWTGLERTTSYPKPLTSAAAGFAETPVARQQDQQEVCDAVVVFPFLTKRGAPTRVVLIRQFRPPVGQWVLELPAGLIDAQEAPEVAAMRELKEETGYVGSRVLHMGPPMVNDQGVTNGKCRLLLVEVQEEEQRSPVQQQLEPDEIIQVVHAPLEGLVDWLEARKLQENDAIDARLYSYALGLHALPPGIGSL